MKWLVFAVFAGLMTAALASCKVQGPQYVKHRTGARVYVQGGYSAVHDRPPIN